MNCNNVGRGVFLLDYVMNLLLADQLFAFDAHNKEGFSVFASSVTRFIVFLINPCLTCESSVQKPFVIVCHYSKLYLFCVQMNYVILRFVHICVYAIVFFLLIVLISCALSISRVVHVNASCRVFCSVIFLQPPNTSQVLGPHPNCQCSTTKFCIKFGNSA